MKEKFIKSTVILLIGGLFTKVFGIIIRITTTRIIGPNGMGLYMLIYPTFSLCMCLSQLSLPTSISKLVSEERYNNKKLISSTAIMILGFNILLMILLFVLAPFISNNLLQDKRTYLPIISIVLVLPFDSLSNLLRGYFFGKQRMFPHVISHIIEQIVRLILIIILIPFLLKNNIIYAVSGLVLVNLVSELISIFVLFFFLPKNTRIKKEDFKPDPINIKNILNISLPTTGGRLIGNIGYFLEPILLTTSLLIGGYSNNYIILEYGIISGYVMPLLLLPSFFTNAISSSLLPIISKAYVDKKYNYIKKKLKTAIILSISIGIPITIFFILKPNLLLNLIYNTNEGTNYLRVLAPIFLLYYIEAPLAATLQAINKSKNIMFDNLKGIITKTILIYVLSLFKIGMYGLIIGTSLNIIITTYCHYKNIKKVLK